jgi:hypothetical protein
MRLLALMIATHLAFFEFPAVAEQTNCSKPLVPGWMKEVTDTYQKEQDSNFQCPDWILKKKDLPACPSTATKATIPETNPKAFVVIGPTANAESVFEMIKKAKKASPDQIPVFLVGQHQEELMKKLKKLDPSFNWKNHVLGTFMGPFDDSLMYIRDPFHTRVNSKGEMEVFHTKINPGITNDFKAVLNACGIKAESAEEMKKTKEDFSQTTLGGNFMTVLPGIHVSTELTPIHEQSGWNSENTINFDFYTNVSHIDEVFQPVQTTYDENGCPKISMLAVSPSKSLELIHEEALRSPEKKAFDLSFEGSKYSGKQFSREYDQFRKSRRLNSITNDSISEILGRGIEDPSAINGFHQICSYYRQLPDLDQLEFNISEYQDVEFTFGKKPSKNIIANQKSSNKTETILLKKGYSASEYANALEKCKKQEMCNIKKMPNPPVPQKECAALTMSDFYKILKNTDYNREQANQLEKEVNRVKLELEKRIASQYPNCTNVMDWIDSPAIYHNGSWALPNSTNSVPVVNGSIAMTDPYIKPFQKYFEQEMKKRKIGITWFDTLGLNNFKKETKTGNLHCSTNSIPLCSPQRLK